MKNSRLNELLQEWTVLPPGLWKNENSQTLGDWYAVCNNDGIVAYFGKAEDAFRFRLAEINRVLNG